MHKRDSGPILDFSRQLANSLLPIAILGSIMDPLEEYISDQRCITQDH